MQNSGRVGNEHTLYLHLLLNAVQRQLNGSDVAHGRANVCSSEDHPIADTLQGGVGDSKK